MFASLMPLNRRSTAGSEAANEGLLLPQHEASVTSQGFGVERWKALFARYQWAAVALAVGFALLMLYAFFPASLQDAILEPLGVATHPANLHILLTASSADLSLCRSLASTMVLGYPAPVLVNWENDGTIADGIRDYLLTLDDSHDNDLILVLQNDDAWLQLRPSTLVDRFFKANQQADILLKSRLGKVATRNDIRQEIILGAQKDCSFQDDSDPACSAAPPSPQPASIYEINADYRPRFHDSGFVMGGLRSMRELFARAAEEPSTKSLQHVLGDVFADQNLYREAVLRDSSYKKQKSAVKPEDISKVREKMAKNKKLDYSIGLDYFNQIGLNTAFAKDQIDTLAFDNPGALQSARDSHGIPNNEGTKQLAADIANALPPYWTFSVEEKLPRWKRWTEIPLFTNLWTAITPVFVYHNGHGDTSKPARESTFEQAWFYKHSRLLVDKQIYAPIIPVAVGGENATMMREFWPYDLWKGGARDAKGIVERYEGYWLRFDESCGPYHEALFDDELGPWVLPENH